MIGSMEQVAGTKEKNGKKKVAEVGEAKTAGLVFQRRQTTVNGSGKKALKGKTARAAKAITSAAGGGGARAIIQRDGIRAEIAVGAEVFVWRYDGAFEGWGERAELISVSHHGAEVKFEDGVQYVSAWARVGLPAQSNDESLGDNSECVAIIGGSDTATKTKKNAPVKPRQFARLTRPDGTIVTFVIGSDVTWEDSHYGFIYGEIVGISTGGAEVRADDKKETTVLPFCKLAIDEADIYVDKSSVSVELSGIGTLSQKLFDLMRMITEATGEAQVLIKEHDAIDDTTDVEKDRLIEALDEAYDNARSLMGSAQQHESEFSRMHAAGAV